jgi:cytochrome c oxidase subunit IV
MSPPIVPKKTYFKVAACLGLLLIATVAAAQFDLGHLNTPLALAIAIAKASLIAAFFMNLRYGSSLLRVFAAGGFVWLAILITLTLADVMTRH